MACDAAPVALGDDPWPLALVEVLGPVLVDVPLGLPEMFSWVTLTPVLFLQLLLNSDWLSCLLTKVTSVHCLVVSQSVHAMPSPVTTYLV